ncbi:YqcC family protein [Alteromonas pelagimontana]|uniref:YqcC family protein n=2 Tax=Alteromonas pelagimontana TaxID=1858656 RepID=A0A6M4MIK0_9ALTE|nr:YqcC family protein [Alteromonas pelagimontana]
MPLRICYQGEIANDFYSVSDEKFRLFPVTAECLFIHALAPYLLPTIISVKSWYTDSHLLLTKLQVVVANYPILQSQLKALEQLLTSRDLWSDAAPTAQALASNQPFSCDTLRFEQWLQFIFIPRFKQLLTNGEALPNAMALAPMAEMSLPDHPDVIEQLKCLDAQVKLTQDQNGKY